MIVDEPSCRALDDADLRGLADVLEATGLPSGDVRLPGRRFFRFADDAGWMGYGGLEGEAPDVLIRSVVVRPERRGAGCGAAIVRALERRAVGLGATRLHLLTETAADFFAGLGYRPAPRASAPLTIAGSRQFASLCPGDARYLVKDIRRDAAA